MKKEIRIIKHAYGTWLEPYGGYEIEVHYYSNRTDMIHEGELHKNIGKDYILKNSIPKP